MQGVRDSRVLIQIVIPCFPQGETGSEDMDTSANTDGKTKQ